MSELQSNWQSVAERLAEALEKQLKLFNRICATADFDFETVRDYRMTEISMQSEKALSEYEKLKK